MPDKKSGFMATAAALFALAFVIGFGMALASIGRSGVLYKFALEWELSRALLYVAAWAPAILLVASAIAMESSEARDGFSGAASRIMAPALALAVIISLFYLLIVPGLEQRKNRCESQSLLFSDSLKLADKSLREGRLEDAERHLLACAAIDMLDESYSALNDRVQSARIKELSVESAALSAEVVPQSEAAAWKAGNRFYLEALEAREAGKPFDAHYLAKRSAAVYSKRPEVQRLVQETWQDLQKLGPTAESLAAAAYYKRKLEGYERFQEGDYLEAYRIYSALTAEDADDADAKAYLARSAEGLSTIAFFIEEDRRAFSRSDERAFSMFLSGAAGWSAVLTASRAAASGDAVYFRDVSLELGGEEPLRVRAPFGRLHGDTLILRAVDRLNPGSVWEPTYESGKPAATRAGAAPRDPGFALQVPFDQQDAEAAIELSGKSGDIPLVLLATGIDDAERLGLDTVPLLAELAKRAAYPFAVLMLVLIGAGLGVRFKPVEPVSTAARYLTAPILVALSLAPLRVIEEVEAVAARAFAAAVPGGMFLPAWLAFMSLCVAVSLFVAARIAGRSAR